MEWFRRMFGYPNRSDDNPFRNPTWEEIFNSRNMDDGMGDHRESFSSVFGQMDDMFRQLDSIMHGFYGHPGQIIIEEPGFGDSLDDISPRDSLLKKPDGKDPSSQEHLPTFPRSSHRHPFFHGPFMTDPEEKRDDFNQDGHYGMWPGHGFGMTDPFQMMEELFKDFGGTFRMEPFDVNPGTPMLHGPGTDPSENPRGSALKKADVILDDRITEGFSDLLKDMPGYDPPVVPGQPSITQPEMIQPQPRVRQSFRSTSIVRIRQPDGSVEETKKYTDSTGREEVTVTRTQPEDGNTPGPLRQDQGLLDGHSTPGHFPSIFSWIFTR